MEGKERPLLGLLALACLVVLWTAQSGRALVVSELMYHPVEEGGTPSGEENLEFIELYNDRGVFEDLSGYAFTNGIEYTFAPGTILGAKQYLVVAQDPAAVQAAYGITGVYGPFESGRFDNDGERIELSNSSGEILISFRYNDTWPWPRSADGTGHSLFLAKLSGDPEEASSWSPSMFIGGTPGGPDESQTAPGEVTVVTLVDVGHPGRYFKGTKEPSPGAGGIATTGWTQIAFNDDPATTEWLDGPTGYGFSTEADELQWISTRLTDMRYNYISAYARMRFALTAKQIASFTQLNAEVHYDDGFVLYLNGQRVADSGSIVGNPPPFSQSGGPSAEPAPINVNLSGVLNLLVPGTNVLAIQGHNATLINSDFVASPILRTVAEPVGGDPRTRLVINELLANSDAPPGTDWIEIYNPGPIAVNLSNVYLSDGRFDLLQYKLPDGLVLQPGEFWAVREGTPPSGFPFALAYNGETIFLTLATNGPSPEPLRVLDAVRFGAVEADVALGRFPDGFDYFGPLSSPSYAAPNAKPWIRDIVINEIMYQHGTRDERYEYVELYNKGAGTVPLNGWAFSDGISYEFGAGAVMPPGSYLVVARDPNLLVTVYNNLVKGSNLFGPYSGELDNHSERIRLSYPYMDPETHDVNMITVDEVTYYDGGRWPSWADGKGASMELRDPRSNNNAPDAWADSDEATKSTWRQYSFTISGSDSQYTHDQVTVFDLMLLNGGEVLLDDLEVIINETNRLTNNGFEAGQSPWRKLGNHVRSFVTTEDSHTGSQSLHLIATGHGDPGANRINQSIAGVGGGTVTFRFWARWLRGSRYLLMRTTREQAPVQPPRPAYSFALDMPVNLGTPGRQNTAFVSNRGPDILDVKHTPVLPAANEPIVVTARVADNNGVVSVMLYYRSEGSGGFTGIPMSDNALSGDLVRGDGIFTATIPSASAGTMRAFYIEASDGSASTRFPTRLQDSANVPNRTCLVRVGDAQPTTPFATYRVWMSNDVINTFTSRPSLSNEMMDCTFVYNNTDVFYNAGIRLRGSPFLRSGFGRNPTGRYAYRFDFNPDQKFRSREEINLDNTEGSSRGPLQERASYWFYRQMGLQYSMQEYVRPVLNGNTYANYEDVQPINGDYIDAWFPGNNDGYIHKIDDYFEYTADGTGYANLDEGLKYDSLHPLLKETYRWGFEKRSNREDDNWDHLFNFAVKMNTPSSNGAAYEAAIRSVMYPQHFAAVLAIRHACGDWDSYGYTRGKNNSFYYALPEGKWYLLPWDIDFTLGSGDGSNTDLFSVTTNEFPEVYQFLNYPRYRQMYMQAFAVLVNGPWQTSYGTANPPTAFDRFLDDAANALIADGGDASRRDGIKAFVRDRRNFILPQVPSLVFMITARVRHIYTSNPTATIGGTAPFLVTGISVNGVQAPAVFSETNAFQVTVPLALGMNVLVLRALDSGGNPIAGLTDSITVTRIPPCSITSVAPTPACSSGTAQLAIHGKNFEPGSATTVTLTKPSEEIGFDALYVQNSEAFDRIEAATLLLDHPDDGVIDPVYAVHPWINLWNSGGHGEFSVNETHFAPPFDVDGTNYAVRFTGYIYAASAGVRCFGVNSDEGFRLSIAGQLVGEYATGRTAATTDVTKNRTAGTMFFDFPAAGRYYLVLDYFENGGGEEIELFQTDSAGGNRRLINVDAELVVFRDDVKRVEATNVVVEDANTIACQVDLDGAETGMWNAIVTPEAGEAWSSGLDNALEIIACLCDFNGDSKVDFLDWAELAESWDAPCSAPGWCGGMDLDFSGSVGAGDLAIFAQEWLLPTR